MYKGQMTFIYLKKGKLVLIFFIMVKPLCETLSITMIKNEEFFMKSFTIFSVFCWRHQLVLKNKRERTLFYLNLLF